MAISIAPGAEPWAAAGERHTGVLVVHGFTGSPQGVRPWAEGLAARGHNVMVPRLPGHGTTTADLATTTWRDWVGEAEMALHGLFERCERVFVAGLSMGGAIALDLAARFPDRVHGVAVVNPAVLTTDPRAKLAPVLGRLPLTVKGVGSDIADPAQKEWAYPKIPTKAVAQFLALQRVARGRLGAVHQPLLLMVSRTDRVVPVASPRLVERTVASTEKEWVWLERSRHVATLDYDRDLIVERTAELVEKHAG